MLQRAFASWTLLQASSGRLAFWFVVFLICGLIVPAATYDPHAPRDWQCQTTPWTGDAESWELLQAAGWDEVPGERVLIEPGCTR